MEFLVVVDTPTLLAGYGELFFRSLVSSTNYRKHIYTNRNFSNPIFYLKILTYISVRYLLYFCCLSKFSQSSPDTQRQSSDGDDSAHNMRRIVISPSPSRENSHSDDTYSDDNSLEEVEATLNNLDDEFEDAEQALSHWTRGSSRQSYTSPGTFTSSYTGSPSFTSLPTFTSRSPVLPPVDPRMRLSRITERTEESRPASGAFSAAAPRQVTRTPDNLRRSALLGAGTPSHSRSSTDPSSDRTLPPPGRTTELIAVFEAQSPGGGHGRAASTPGFRASSPLVPSTTATGYEYGSTSYGYGSTSYGYGSRPSSPTKSSGSSGSYTGPSLLSPPVHTTSSGFRSTTPGETRTGTGSYTSPPTYTATPSTFSNTLTQSYTNTNTNTYTTGTPYTQSVTGTPYTNTGSFTQTSATPPAGLRRPQTSPRSPLASVRNIVALWKERTPTKSGERPGIGSGSSVSPPLPDDEGLFGIRRRVQRTGQRLRETSTRDPIAPTRSGEQLVAADNASIRSIRSGVLPSGFDAAEFSPYTQSEEAVSIFFSPFPSLSRSFSSLAPAHRYALVSQRSCIAPVSLAALSGFTLSTHASVVLACTGRRSRDCGPRFAELHKRSICAFADSSQCSR